MCRFSIRAVLSLAAAVASAGCASDIAYSTRIELSTQDSGVEADALESAVRAFLGDDADSGADGGPFDDVGSISSRPIDKVRSQAATVRVRAQQGVNDNLFLVGELSLSQGNGRYSLPQGTDILTDPATISFASTAANATLGLSRIQSHPYGISSEWSGGAGYRLSRTRTRISSDLLAVDSDSTDGDAFVYLGASVLAPTGRRTNAYLTSRGRLYTSGSADVQIAAGLAFE